MLLEGKVGPITQSDGSSAPLRTDRTGSLVVASPYAEWAARGQLFVASMQAGASLGTALTTTAVTFTLYNPLKSGVNVVLLDCVLAITAAPAGAASYVYAANVNPLAAAPATNTDLAIRGSPIGNSATGRAKAYSATTLPATPVVIRVHSSIVATGAASPWFAVDRVDGAIVLGENTAVTIQGLTTASSGIISMTWAEVPA